MQRQKDSKLDAPRAHATTKIRCTPINLASLESEAMRVATVFYLTSLNQTITCLLMNEETSRLGHLVSGA